jgi:hypothetical protein
MVNFKMKMITYNGKMVSSVSNMNSSACLQKVRCALPLRLAEDRGRSLPCCLRHCS